MALVERPINVRRGETSTGPTDQAAHDQARILIVDDDPVIRAIIMDIVTDEGYETIEATSSAHATKIVDGLGSGLRLVLLDAWHAEASIQFARYLTDRGITAPIVVFSNYPAVDESITRQIGTVGVLPRPFDIDALIRLVGRFADTVA